MLTISEGAAQAITGLVGRPEVPDGSGLRMTPRAVPGEPTAVELALVEGPAGSDQVIEEQGVQVFVDNELAPVLDDKVLEATVEEDRINFKFVKHPPA
jgi:Fe-S cluster assembly iron-binding protein IscA